MKPTQWTWRLPVRRLHYINYLHSTKMSKLKSVKLESEKWAQDRFHLHHTEETPEVIPLSRKCFYFLKSCSMCVHTLLFCCVMKLKRDTEGAADRPKAWAFLFLIFSFFVYYSRFLGREPALSRQPSAREWEAAGDAGTERERGLSPPSLSPCASFEF